MSYSPLLERPDRSDGEFQRIAIGIPEIDRRRASLEGEFQLDLHALFPKVFSPGAELIRFHAEGNVARPAGAVGWKDSFLARYLGAEEQQYAGSGEKGSAAVCFKFIRELEPENIAVKRHRAPQICDVER